MPGLANLVRVTVSGTPGTGTITLSSAVSGFLTPIQAGMIDGFLYDYAIEADYVVVGDDSIPTSREVGIGTYNSGTNALARTLILNSTNSNAALSLTSDAQVIITTNSRTVRDLFRSSRTYYVSASAGSDSNDGLAASRQFQTIQKAINTIMASDCGQFIPTVSVADGTYNESLFMGGPAPGAASNSINFVGNTGTPANVVINGSMYTDYLECGFNGFKFVSATDCMQVDEAGWIDLYNVEFGACGGTHMVAVRSGTIYLHNNYAISGGAANHLYSSLCGTHYNEGGRTVTITGSPTFTGAFAVATQNGTIINVGTTYSGLVNGKRYTADQGGIIQTTGGVSYFPGTVPGTASLGGFYNGVTTRELLTAARTYFVRHIIGAPTFTNASANVTLTSHGLSVNNQVAISIIPNTRAVTVTNANPGVWTTSSAHGLVAGNPVVFSAVGYLPAGIVPGTTYFVIATGLTTTAFQVSATVGGAGINTSKLTFTAASGTGAALQITNTGVNNLVAGQIVAFSSTTTLPGGLSASTNYFVAASPAPTSTVFYVSTTNGGTNVAFVNAGTGTHSLEQVGATGSTYNYGSNVAAHYVAQAGAMPTFSTAGLLVQGAVYYVGTVVNANTITLSTTVGNANPLGTATVATGTPVYSLATGSDAQSGLSDSTADAWLTPQHAWDVITGQLDVGGQTVAVNLADGVYITGWNFAGPWTGGGTVSFNGDNVTPSNCFINITTASTDCIHNTAPLPGSLFFDGFKFACTGTAIFHSGGGGILTGAIEYGACTTAHVYLNAAGASVSNYANYRIVGGATYHVLVNSPGSIHNSGTAKTVTGVPAFGGACGASGQQGQISEGGGFVGSATGTRYTASGGGFINSTGGGANYYPGNVAGSPVLNTLSGDGSYYSG